MERIFFNKNKDILIDLSKLLPDNDTLSNRNEIIHRDQLDEVCKILHDKIKSAEGYDPSCCDKFKSQNDVISIFARRGAGKTTFVKSLVHLLRNSNEEYFTELRKDLCCVDVLEPNMIQNKENLIIRFLAQIGEIFNKYTDDCFTYKNGCLIDAFKDAQNKLYESLPAVDGVGANNLYVDWNDSAYISEENMKLASNIKELEKRLHDYLYKGLQLIKKKALLFVLDDSDVNIGRSFDILEIIRLYFTSPQIIVLLTGDVSLYSMIIRRNYWKYFDKELLEKECLTLDESCQKFKVYQKMIYRLEAQYLQKMVKADHRIFLNNIYDKIHIYNSMPEGELTNFFVKLNDSKGEREIRELYKEILKDFDISNKLPTIQKIYIDHLLAQPFRNQLRLFTVYNQYLNNPIVKNNRTEVLSKGILKVFEVYINQHTGDSKYLMAHSPVYPAWILKFLVENQILAVGSSLLPEMKDDSLKNAIIALGISCAEQLKNDSSMIFDYWIRISFIKQISLFLHEPIDEASKENKLITYSDVYTDCGLDKILGNMLAYCIASGADIEQILNSPSERILEPNNFLPGAIIKKRLYSLHKQSTTTRLIEMLQTGIVSSDKKITTVYSIYRPLAIIGSLLRNLADKEFSFEMFSNLFEQVFQMNLYMEPDVNIPTKRIIKGEQICMDPIIGDVLDEQLESDNLKFKRCMYDWGIKKKKERIAPYLLDRIFSRYFDTMLDIDNRTSSFNLPLGDYISDAVLALWNAALVEILIMLEKTEGAILNKGMDITIAFTRNFSFAKKNNLLRNRSRIDTWLFDCPILREYVDPFYLDLFDKIEKGDIDELNIMPIVRERSQNYIRALHTKDLDYINANIKELQQKIDTYNQYNKLSDEIHQLNLKIEIHEEQIKKKTVSLKNKLGYQKIVQQLIEDCAKKKRDQYQLGIESNIYDIDDELRESHSKMNEYKKKKSELESQEVLSLISMSDSCKIVYDNMKCKAEEEKSIYSILNS